MQICILFETDNISRFKQHFKAKEIFCWSISLCCSCIFQFAAYINKMKSINLNSVSVCENITIRLFLFITSQFLEVFIRANQIHIKYSTLTGYDVIWWPIDINLIYQSKRPFKDVHTADVKQEKKNWDWWRKTLDQ